jgi:hypothetical protein
LRRVVSRHPTGAPADSPAAAAAPARPRARDARHRAAVRAPDRRGRTRAAAPVRAALHHDVLDLDDGEPRRQRAQRLAHPAGRGGLRDCGDAATGQVVPRVEAFGPAHAGAGVPR